MTKRFYADFGAALAQLDRSALAKNLAASRIALRRASDSWHTIEGVVATIKVDQNLVPADESALLAMFAQACDVGRQGVQITTELFDRILAPVGLVELMAKNEPEITPILTLKSLPPHDAAEFRAAGLTDIEILSLLRTGLSSFGSVVASTKKFGATATMLASLTKAGTGLDRIRQIGIDGWRSDIIDGHSDWKKFWGAVQMIAGGGAMVVDALAGGAVEGVTLGLATPLALPAVLTSAAMGLGLAANGAKEFDPS